MSVTTTLRRLRQKDHKLRSSDAVVKVCQKKTKKQLVTPPKAENKLYTLFLCKYKQTYFSQA